MHCFQLNIRIRILLYSILFWIRFGLNLYNWRVPFSSCHYTGAKQSDYIFQAICFSYSSAPQLVGCVVTITNVTTTDSYSLFEVCLLSCVGTVKKKTKKNKQKKNLLAFELLFVDGIKQVGSIV